MDVQHKRRKTPCLMEKAILQGLQAKPKSKNSWEILFSSKYIIASRDRK